MGTAAVAGLSSMAYSAASPLSTQQALRPASISDFTSSYRPQAVAAAEAVQASGAAASLQDLLHPDPQRRAQAKRQWQDDPQGEARIMELVSKLSQGTREERLQAASVLLQLERAPTLSAQTLAQIVTAADCPEAQRQAALQALEHSHKLAEAATPILAQALADGRLDAQERQELAAKVTAWLGHHADQKVKELLEQRAAKGSPILRAAAQAVLQRLR